MKKHLYPYRYTVLFGVASIPLLTVTGCSIFADFEPVFFPTGTKEYYCRSEIYRELEDPLKQKSEFTEAWHTYVYPDSDTIPISEVKSLCLAKRAEYIQKSMSPNFDWQVRDMIGPTEILSKQNAADCFLYGERLPVAPDTYGGPIGAKLLWQKDLSTTPDPTTYFDIQVELTDKNGEKHTANPEIKRVTMEYAERHGVHDDFGQYDPEKYQLRMTDLFLEVEPFQLAGVDVTKLYIQSIGTQTTRERSGSSYQVDTANGKTKFFLGASTESITDQRCFVASTFDGTNALSSYQGPPYSFFNTQLQFQQVGSQPLDISLNVSSPMGVSIFKEHQPFISLKDKNAVSPVSLSVGVGENIPGGDGLVFDHDNDIDRVLWFSSFENEDENFLGEGTDLGDVYFPAGKHKITVVAFDQRGAYNSDTMTITVNAPNRPPVAVEDSYMTNEDTVAIYSPGVLENDSDPDYDPLTAILVTGPSNGTLNLSPNGSFTYTPNANFNGSDSFTYKANDGEDDSNITIAKILVIPVNDPPIANDDTFITDEDEVLNVPAPGVLGNDSDVDGDSLKAITVNSPTNGTLVLQQDGSFIYTPNPNFFGEDYFSYKLNDGIVDSTNTANVKITVTELSAQDEFDGLEKLVRELPLSDGQANSLLVILDEAEAKFEVGDINVSCQLLKAFINHIQGFVEDGVLSPQEAQTRIEKANNLQIEYGCL